MMAFGFKMLYEKGQGDFVLLFTIDWPLVDIYELIYSIGTTKRQPSYKPGGISDHMFGGWN
jgi:hypothetical protein